MRRAIIKPLLKKMGLDLVSKNYRPVSNLSFLSKLIEKVVALQFTNHLEKNGLLDSYQSAYRKYHSTETALLRVHNDISMETDGKNVSLLVLLDLSAAFDTIDHDILLNRLKLRYGIKGTALSWFKSYLTSRSQTVIINGTESEPQNIKYGVPQGSVLGPLLFTAYLAPLSDVLEKYGLKYHCYADDTQLYISFRPIEVGAEELAIETLEKAISDIKLFMVKNKLKLNDDKTEFLLLGTKARLSQAKYNHIKIGESHIECSDEARNLGVIFDKHLTLEPHVNNVVKSSFYNIKNLWKIRKFLNQDHTNIAAHAFVTSKLDYANALLGGAPKFLIGRLQRVQNAAARVVTKTRKYDHISEKMKELHWLPICNRIKYKINLITWKALNGQAPKYITELLETGEINLRSNNNKLLHIPKTNLVSQGDKAYAKVAPVLWNSLPTTLRSMDKLTSFKKGLKTFYFKESYDL